MSEEETLIIAARAIIAAYAEEYNRVSVHLQELLAPLKRLEAEVREAVLDAGCTVEVRDTAKVTYRKGYTRTSWNGKALEGYMVAHPEVEAFRKESTVKPSVSIKVYD